jgi:hypothetical protein
LSKSDPVRRRRLLTAKQVLKRLMAEPHLLRRGVTCSLPAVRSGRGWRFAQHDLDDWISRQKAVVTLTASRRTSRG